MIEINDYVKNPLLEINNLQKSFGKDKVLNSVTWDIEKGRIYGLIGKNGAGKSTLLRCISGIYEFDEGEILFENTSIVDNPNVKRDILLLSDYPFELKQSNLIQLTEFYKIFYANFDSQLYKQLVSLFNFDEKRPLHKASKGIKRQASLIIALSLKPKLLLLDESYDGLDPYVRLDLTKFLKENFINEDRSIIISSHNIHELEHLCDEMVILENGVIHQQTQSQEQTSPYLKVQVGFNYDVQTSQLQSLNALDIEKEGRVFKIIVDDSLESFKEKIKDLHPALIYPLDLPIQELYLKKIEVKHHETTL